MSPLLQKLLNKTVKSDDGCWVWQGNVRGFANQYGAVKVGGRRGKLLYAHRLVYEELVGPIEAGKLLMHKCNRPRCCNPEHLFQGTHKENSQQMVRDGRARCGDRIAARAKVADLSETQVAEIKRELLVRKWGQQTNLAGKYGVSISTINLIAKGKTWKDIQP